MRSHTLVLDQTSALLTYATLLVVLLISALVVALSVSGRLAAFGEAFEHFVIELFRGAANRLHSLQEQLKAFASDARNAGKFFAAILCLLVAGAVAVANYHVLYFSFELLLPVGDALTTAAVTYVALKAVAGILVHFLDKGAARRLVIATILVASLCATALAYMRAVAMMEVSKATTLTDSGENVLTINTNFAAGNEQTSEPIAEPISPDSEVLVGPFLLEGLIVAAIALVIDTFELLCVFGALQLSIAGVVSFVCLPVRLPLAITKEAFSLTHQTGLAAVISIAVRAILETPKIVTLWFFRILVKLSLLTITGFKSGAMALWIGMGVAIVRWRKRDIYRLRLSGVVERVALREANRRSEIRSSKDCDDDYRTSRRRSFQLENKFAEDELTADLKHRAEINRALRASGSAILAQNLEKVETVFDNCAALLKNEILARGHTSSTVAADTLAPTVTQAITEQYQRMTEPPIIPSKQVIRLEPSLRRNGGSLKPNSRETTTHSTTKS